MPREANAVDFWRGFTLRRRFHRSHAVERLTHRDIFSISDSAEMFVFLAGWSLGLLVVRGDEPFDTARLVARLGGRAVTNLRRAYPDQLARHRVLASTAFLTDDLLVLECLSGSRTPGAGPDAHRARASHPSARLFRHPAALRDADADCAGACSHRPLRPAACRCRSSHEAYPPDSL